MESNNFTKTPITWLYIGRWLTKYLPLFKNLIVQNSLGYEMNLTTKKSNKLTKY